MKWHNSSKVPGRRRKVEVICNNQLGEKIITRKPKEEAENCYIDLIKQTQLFLFWFVFLFCFVFWQQLV